MEMVATSGNTCYRWDMETTATTFAQKVAANLRAEMARQNLTINDLAAAMGCTRPTARSRYFGRSPLTIGELGAAAQMLGVGVEVLVYPAIPAEVA